MSDILGWVLFALVIALINGGIVLMGLYLSGDLEKKS